MCRADPRNLYHHAPCPAAGTHYSGDHLNALCRALARIRLRENVKRPTEPDDIERALTEWLDLPNLTKKDLAALEAGLVKLRPQPKTAETEAD